MLLLVLIFVLAAFGLLLIALMTGTAAWAWVSVAVSVAAAGVLVIDWAKRRAAVSDGDRAGASALMSPEMADLPTTMIPTLGSGMEPVTEVFPALRASGAPQGGPSAEHDRGDDQVGVVAPSGSPEQPPGAGPGVDKLGRVPSQPVTFPDSERSNEREAPVTVQMGDSAEVVDPAAGSTRAVEEPDEPEQQVAAPTARPPSAAQDKWHSWKIQPAQAASADQPDQADESAGPAGPSIPGDAERADEPSRPDEARDDAEPSPAGSHGPMAAPTDANAAPASASAAPALASAAPAPVNAVNAAAGDANSAAAANAAPGDAHVSAGDGNTAPGHADAAKNVEATTAIRPVAALPPANEPAGETIGLFSPLNPAVPPRTGDAEPAKAIGSPPAAPEPGEERVSPAAAAIVASLDDEVLVVDEKPRYHLAGCRTLTGRETIPLSAKEAVEYEFTPCEACSPVSVLAARSRAASNS